MCVFKRYGNLHSSLTFATWATSSTYLDQTSHKGQYRKMSLPTGKFFIVSNSSSMVLGLEDDNQAAGVSIVLLPFSGDVSQQWSFHKVR